MRVLVAIIESTDEQALHRRDKVASDQDQSTEQQKLEEHIAYYRRTVSPISSSITIQFDNFDELWGLKDAVEQSIMEWRAEFFHADSHFLSSDSLECARRIGGLQSLHAQLEPIYRKFKK